MTVVVEENPISNNLSAPSSNGAGYAAPNGNGTRADASRTAATALEQDTQERGRALLTALRQEEGRADTSDVLYARLMALTTANDKLKVELFRFVDALPSLKTPESVARHLAEYLLQPGIPLPPGAGVALRLIAATGPTRRIAAWASHTGASMMARRFIAGANAREAAGAIAGLRKRHIAFTLDLLGEAVTSESDALIYQKQYLDLIRDLAPIVGRWEPDNRTDATPFGPIPRANVSVKLSSLYARFDPMAADATAAAVKERLRPILDLARQTGAFVNVDMEQNDFRALTFRIFRETLMEPAYRDWTDVGIVVQTYLLSAEDDIRALRDWAADERGTPVWIRLVKGAYWDYETIIAAQRGHPVPVFQTKPETDASFERCADFLIENWQTLRPALATHNVRSAARAQALAAAYHLPPNAIEFQALYGMGDSIARALTAQGERVRVYVPFGELLPGMAYLVRRLLENSSNDSFVRQAGEPGDVGLLLKTPHSRTGHRASLPVKRLVAPTPGPSPVPGEGSLVKRTVGPEEKRGVQFQTPLSQRSGRGAGGGGIHSLDSPTSFTNNPETDFALDAKRTAMQTALESVRAQLGMEVPIVIGGKREMGASVVERADPSESGRVVSRVHYATQDQATRAIDAAQAAFTSWRETPVATRARMLRRVAAEFERRRFEISAWMVFEVGKPWRDADGDVAEAIDFCHYYAGEMERLDSGGHKRNIPGEWNEYLYEARGPAVIIAPWNFPLAILAGMATAALVAGNPIVLKPAEQSSRIGYFLMEALEAAGVPPGVASFLPGDGEIIGPTLTDDPRTAVIAFTGSRAVGLSIIASAAQMRPGQREIKRVVAELGGKNAIIVDEDADLDEAVLGVVASAVGFAGQKCSACSRVIVIGDAYESFCTRLTHAIATIRIGPAEDPATTLGPVVDADSYERIHRYGTIGAGEGKLLAQAAVPDALLGKGNYVPATVFVDCPPDGRLCREEIFGPVVAVLHVPTLTQALRLADDSDYALTGGLYSRSPENIARVRREFRVGNLYINRKITGALVDRQPFGGARMSGVGSKAGGPDYLLQFLVPRTITESVMRRGFAPSEEAGGAGI